jgi:hypothetical protein
MINSYAKVATMYSHLNCNGDRACGQKLSELAIPEDSESLKLFLNNAE